MSVKGLGFFYIMPTTTTTISKEKRSFSPVENKEGPKKKAGQKTTNLLDLL